LTIAEYSLRIEFSKTRRCNFSAIKMSEPRYVPTPAEQDISHDEPRPPLALAQTAYLRHATQMPAAYAVFLKTDVSPSFAPRCWHGPGAYFFVLVDEDAIFHFILFVTICRRLAPSLTAELRKPLYHPANSRVAEHAGSPGTPAEHRRHA